MPFESKVEDDCTVVTVDEVRLDAALAEPFKNYLFDQIENGAETMVIDLTSVKFMDSSGLGSLVAALKKMAGSGKIRLGGPQPAVRDLFDLTSMEKLFPIFDSVEDAIEGD